MKRVNLRALLMGGLLAGFVLNCGEYILNEILFKRKIEELSTRLHIPTPGGTFIAVAVVMTFILGIVLVTIYAFARSRFGPGPGTAVIAATVGWFCIYVYAGVLNAVIFGLPGSLLVVGVIWGFCEYAVATIFGAWLYSEP